MGMEKFEHQEQIRRMKSTTHQLRLEEEEQRSMPDELVHGPLPCLYWLRRLGAQDLRLDGPNEPADSTIARSARRGISLAIMLSFVRGDLEIVKVKDIV